MKEIPLTQGKVALVDDSDYAWLMQWKWTYEKKGYAVRFTSRITGRKKVFMHRLINQTPKDMETDHINRNKLDNRRVNLRSCSPWENTQNSSVIKEGQPKGIRKIGNKWQARISIKQNMVNLGLYSSLEQAEAVYKEAVSKFHG